MRVGSEGYEGIKQDAQTTVRILAFTLNEMGTIRES